MYIHGMHTSCIHKYIHAYIPKLYPFTQSGFIVVLIIFYIVFVHVCERQRQRDR